MRRFFYKNRACKNPLFFLKEEKGVAITEMLFLLIVFVMFFGLTFGFWSTIHSGTLNSIGARHYAFEVLNNRTHFIYHRDRPDTKVDSESYYKKNGYRFFAVVQYQPGDEPDLKSLEGKLNWFDGNKAWNAGKNRTEQKANPVWIKSGYGICIDFNCGD